MLTPIGSDDVLPRASTRKELRNMNRQSVGLAAQGTFNELSARIDCQHHCSVLEAFSLQSSDSRELIWDLLHHEMMGPETVVPLLDLEEQRAYQKVRAKAAEWIGTASGKCTSPGYCRDLASYMMMADEATCPTRFFLTQAQQQLDGARSHGAVERESLRTPDPLRRGNASSTERALRLWGINLLQPELASPPDVSAAAPTAPAGATSSRVQADRLGAALSQLHVLARSLADPDADLLHLVRRFLKEAEKARGGPRLTTTGSPDKLLGLVRLLYEQRSQAAATSLVRDALLVDFHEAQVRGLEEEWARFDKHCAHGRGCSDQVGELSVPFSKEGSAAHLELKSHATTPMLASLQARAKQLSAILSRLAADDATVLPVDAGALPAYWMGRVERVRRRLDGYTREGVFRPTILIWTCSFGGGHRVAARALQAYFPEYNVVVTDPSKDREYYEGDTLGNWVRRFVHPDWDMTYVFNKIILRDKVYQLETLYERFQDLRGWLRGDGTRFARPCAPGSAPWTCDTAEKKLMRRVLLRTAPDFVITIYHMDLGQIAELCNELGGLPIMHLATDTDAKMRHVFRERPAYPNLRIGVPFDLPEVWPTIRPLLKSQTFLSGYSVRTAFLRPMPTPAERDAERSRRGIRRGARVLLVMSGSEGQSVDWPRELADSETWEEPLHVIAVVAHNRDFAARLESQLQPVPSGRGTRFRGANARVTVEVAREPRGGRGDGQSADDLFVDEVSSLMDVADVLITKPGGSTVAEAAYRGIPMIFDATSGLLAWEDFNAHVFESHGRGIRMTSISDLEHSLRLASRLNRSQSLVSDSMTGQAIDTRRKIRQEMQQMLDTFTKTQQRL